MDEPALRMLLGQLEEQRLEPTDQLAALAFVAGRRVELDGEELKGARRRAILLLATGGDPHAGLKLDGRAVTALAGDLDRPERHTQLAHGLEELRGAALGLPSVEATVAALLADPELAWRAYACGLLAEEL
jgi:hypothetical protein